MLQRSELFMFFFSGPAESLFKESYYQLMKAALRSDGILCSQGKFFIHHSLMLIIARTKVSSLGVGTFHI